MGTQGAAPGEGSPRGQGRAGSFMSACLLAAVFFVLLRSVAKMLGTETRLGLQDCHLLAVGRQGQGRGLVKVVRPCESLPCCPCPVFRSGSPESCPGAKMLARSFLGALTSLPFNFKCGGEEQGACVIGGGCLGCPAFPDPVQEVCVRPACKVRRSASLSALHSLRAAGSSPVRFASHLQEEPCSRELHLSPISNCLLKGQRLPVQPPVRLAALVLVVELRGSAVGVGSLGSCFFSAVLRKPEVGHFPTHTSLASAGKRKEWDRVEPRSTLEEA